SWDQPGQVARSTLGRPVRGHDDVHTVRSPAGVRVQPAQYRVELVRVVEPYATEDPEPAGAADRGRHLFGRGEADDRVLDPEQVTQGRTHNPPYACPLAYSAAHR